MITIESLIKLRNSEYFRGFEGVDGPTPIWLCEKQINSIPCDYTDPSKLWIFPSVGHGTHAIDVYWRYMEGLSDIFIDKQERSRHILKNMLYLNEINPWLCRQLSKQGFINVIKGDYINFESEMKFDIVVGNPPFTKDVGGGNSISLWDKFVEKTFIICKEGGHVSLIHPNGWRNIKGSFKKTQKLLLSKKIEYLELHSTEDGKKTFGVTTPYDFYVIKNINDSNGVTIVKDYNNVESIQNLNNLEFIPNSNFELINSLIAKNDEEKVEIIEDSSYHHQREYISAIQDDTHQYPCVYSVYKNGTYNFKYSSIDTKGHFGITKLILGNGANPTCFIDENGEYGMTQFAFAIVDSLENLIKIKEVLESEKFAKVTQSTKYVATAGNPLVYPKILKTFRKDFWREFVNE
jgi:peptide methionine sulfoxide reductase MsrB